MEVKLHIVKLILSNYKKYNTFNQNQKNKGGQLNPVNFSYTYI